MDWERIFDKLRNAGAFGIKITLGGEDIIDERWAPDGRINLYSVSKSFTSCAVGFALQEGLLSLDEKLCDAFCEDMPEHIDGNLAKATVRDLLTMRLGQERIRLIGDRLKLRHIPDWVKMVLAEPFDYAPGEHFYYSNVGPYLAGVLVQRRAGCDLVDYLMPRLFEPLGIERPNWERDPRGDIFGASGLELSLCELHEFGLLCLARGYKDGRSVIPESWIDECSRRQSESPYSYLFWLDDEGKTFRADGRYSQLCVICPEKQAVVTITAHEKDGSVVRDTIYEDILPRMGIKE